MRRARGRESIGGKKKTGERNKKVRATREEGKGAAGEIELNRERMHVNIKQRERKKV